MRSEPASLLLSILGVYQHFDRSRFETDVTVKQSSTGITHALALPKRDLVPHLSLVGTHRVTEKF